MTRAAGLAVVPQAFEAEIFGAPVWRLEVAGEAPLKDLPGVVDAARREGVALMACRLPDGDARGQALERAGFRRIERLVTFERMVGGGPAAAAELAAESEAEACAAIAAGAFVHDRFHADPKVPAAIADEIKRRWVLNDVRGRADAPIVLRQDGEIGGFNLCLRRGETAVIDLIAVAPAHQGKGLGRALVRAGLAHYAGKCCTVRAGTQEANESSIALYEGEGFRAVAAAETYHWTP